MKSNVDFKICMYTYNGINDNNKRKDSFEFLRQQKSSIYFLHETHLKVESERFTRSCLGYSTWPAGSHTNLNAGCFFLQ